MGIKRGPKPERGFTIIDNTALRDRALSFRARGILGYVLSNTEGWETSAEAIARMGTEGRDAVRTALNELEAAGYLKRTPHRGADGKWATDWTMYETPQAEDETAGQDRRWESASDNPRRFNRSGSTASDSQALKEEDHQEDHQEDTATPAASATSPEEPTTLFVVASVEPEPEQALPPAPDPAKVLLQWWWERQDPKPAGRGAWHSGLAAIKAVLEAGHGLHDVGMALKFTPPPLSIGALEFALNSARRPTREQINRQQMFDRWEQNVRASQQAGPILDPWKAIEA
jgi:hypothetical protein